MESYIVRIYRRGQSDPDEVAGLVETVGADEKRAFRSFSDLMSVIRRAIDEDYYAVAGGETHSRMHMADRQSLGKRHGS